MAKSKDKSKGQGVPNKPIYSRISFLYQAAAYLGSTSSHQQSPVDTKQVLGKEVQPLQFQGKSSEMMAKQTMSRALLTGLRATSRKTQIRLSPAMKHTICKYCDTFLVESATCTSFIENQSKGGKKPWADVLVVKCKTCEQVRRFPVQTQRQIRRPLREAEPQEKRPSHQTTI